MYMWMNIYSHEHVNVCGHACVYIVNEQPLNSIEHSTYKYKLFFLFYSSSTVWFLLP